MYKRFSKELAIKLFIIVIAICLYSCGSTKHLRYFQDIPDTTKLSYIKLSNFTTPVLKPGQVVSVNIYTIELSATQSINTVNTTVAATQGTVIGFDESGYLIDKDGYIELPELGKIKVDNLNIEQAQATIKERASKYFNDPIVIVKSRSFKITFVGEFQKTGTFIIPSEKFTIIDALGLSGGLTDQGKRDNVLLLRQNDNNTISTVRIDLKSSSILKSNYYYLQNNDVLLADPSRSKGISTDLTFSRYLTLYSLIGSILTTIIVLFKR